jgi:hypothetical protein
MGSRHYIPWNWLTRLNPVESFAAVQGLNQGKPMRLPRAILLATRVFVAVLVCTAPRVVKKVVRRSELLKGHYHGFRFQACS